MGFRSSTLPGIGTKYEISTDNGDTVAIFYMKSGNIQMYNLPKGAAVPCVAELTPVEARRLGNILSGAIMEADRESVEIAFSALSDLRISVHAYLVPKTMVGQTIEGLSVRAKTGTTIIAVSRGNSNIINPVPNFVFEGGDAMVVIGESDQLKTFEREFMVS